MLQLPVAQPYLFLEIGVSNRLKLICFLFTEKGATLLAGDCLTGLDILYRYAVRFKRKKGTFSLH